MKNAKLQTLFVDACHYGNLRTAIRYLKDGARVNVPDGRGYYPLHMACQENHIKIVRFLINNGARLNLKDSNGKGEAALFRATGMGHIRIVKCLIKNGCSVNVRSTTISGDTPLHIACAWGRFKITVELVHARARIGALNEEKLPPIYYAVLNGHCEIVDFLIKYNATASRVLQFKKLLLKLAVEKADTRMITILTDIKSVPNRND